MGSISNIDSRLCAEALIFEKFIYTSFMLRIFRQIALWEAISTIFLFFVAMPIKYLLPLVMAVPEDIRLGTVRIAGSIHGFLVVLFVILLLMCWSEYKWSFKRVLTYMVVSLIPVVSFWIEKDLKKDIAAR